MHAFVHASAVEGEGLGWEEGGVAVSSHHRQLCGSPDNPVFLQALQQKVVGQSVSVTPTVLTTGNETQRNTIPALRRATGKCTCWLIPTQLPSISHPSKLLYLPQKG